MTNSSAALHGFDTEKLRVVLGEEGLEKLAHAHVLVLGCGGVGSNCVEALARGGVGELTIFDHDVVSLSNINRQAIAFHSTVGKAKVHVMRDMIADINPLATVHARPEFVLTSNLAECLEGDYDYIIDAIDTISTKLSLAKYAQDHNLPLISAMGAANKRDPFSLRCSDVFDTVNCPVCRIMRKEGRKRGIERLQVVYSCEQPIATQAQAGTERRERTQLGTMSYMPALMGQMIASFVICSLLGWNEDSVR